MGNYKSPVTEAEVAELEKKIREEERTREKIRRKAVTDQVLRFLGLVLATMIFLVSFSMTVGLTMFARIFGLRAKEIWSEKLDFVFEEGTIYQAIIGSNPTIAIILMTFIQVALGVGLAFLVSYYIRDLIGIIKNLIVLGRNITEELGTNLKEGVQDLSDISKRKKKKLFEDEKEGSTSVSVINEPISNKKRGRKPKEKNTYDDFSTDPLDSLTHEQQDLILQGKATAEEFLTNIPVETREIKESKRLF